MDLEEMWNGKTPCPCKCGHKLDPKKDPRNDSSVFGFIKPGCNKMEYYSFIHKPGGLCFECHHQGCEKPPEKWIATFDGYVHNPEYDKWCKN